MSRLRYLLVVALFASALGALIPAIANGGSGADRFTGRLQVAHSDDFAHGRATFDYFLNTGSKQLFIDTRGRSLMRYVGDRVTITGIRSGNGLVLSQAAGAVDTLSVAPAVSGPKRVAVIMFNFSNDNSQPWTAATVRGVVFDNTNSVANYYNQASYGQVTLTGTVFGWYTISATNAGCDWSTWGSQAYNLAKAQNPTLASYDYVVYAFPYASSCGWAGLGYIAGSGAWINGSMDLRVVGHELGHNLGVHHASSLSCTSGGQPVSYSSTCTASEYGDPFSIMGSASTYLPNNWHRAQFGWLPDTTTVTTSGTYQLRPDEGTATPRGLRIARGDGTYYWLDLRQPGSTFDTFAASDPAVNGVAIRIVPDTTSIVQSKLLDMNPSTPTFADAPLAVGESFTDTTLGVTIKTLSVSAAGAVVSITFGGGGGGSGDTQAPTAPPGLAAQALSVSSIKLTWSSSTDNVGVTGYRISRNGTQITQVTGTTYTDTGLAASTTFQYSVVAIDAAGNVSPASVVSAKTLAADTTPPTAPSNLRGSSRLGTLSLTWSASTDNVGVTGYQVFQSGTQIAQVTGLSYTFKPPRGHTYTYTVRAVDAAGNASSFSNAVSLLIF